MRTLIISAAIMLGLAVGGCERGTESDEAPTPSTSTVVRPETRVDTVPQEEPAVARSQWSAANEAARTVTGNLRVSIEGNRGGPLIFAFANGITVRAQPYEVAPADSRSGVGGQSFAAVLGGDPRVDVYLYRVLNENVTVSATQGGLCGEAVARNLAVSEFVDGSGRWAFKLAAFRGEASPPSGADPVLCNSFAYTAQ